MSRHPILTALDTLDDEPSAEFSGAMRARLFAELVHPSELEDASNIDEQHAAAEVEVDEQGAHAMVRTFEPRSKRTGSLLAAAAGIVLVAAFAVAVVTRRSAPANSDINDREIARTALIAVADLGSLWQDSHGHDGFTTRDEASVAATIPSCSPYVDSVFDGAQRDAATSQKYFHYSGIASSVLSDVVSVFPSKAAASRVMDKITESTFRSCFAGYLEKAAPILSTGDSVTSSVVGAPPLLPHGDRQIAFETVNVYHIVGVPVPITSVNIFIQVDRAIVYVNPEIDRHDSLDPKSSLEIVMKAATNSLTLALSQTPRS